MLVSQFKSLGVKSLGSGPVSAALSVTAPVIIIVFVYFLELLQPG